MSVLANYAGAAVRKFTPHIWEEWWHINYLRRCAPRKVPSSDAVAKAVRSLEEDGYVILRSYLSADWADAVLPKVQKHLHALVDGVEPDGCGYMRTDGDPQTRIDDIDKLVPETNRFFDDTFVDDVFKSYACENIEGWRRMVDWRSGVGMVNGTDTRHFDDPYPSYKLKAFLYLNDVGPKNGPFYFTPKTHLNPSWRRPKNREAVARGLAGDWGHFTEPHYRYILKRYGLKEIACTGNRGDLILFDAGGIHRSSVLQEGERYMLARYFEVPAEKPNSIGGVLKRRTGPHKR